MITILGPTAVGKTKLAAKLAFEFNGEIISADSRQVYRGMDIGTGKDLNDYLVDGEKIKYHLIDIIDPQDEFNLFLFKKYFNSAFEEIRQKNKLPFLVGGTGLYLSSVLQNYKLSEVNFNNKKIKELDSKSIDELKSILLALNPKLHNTTDLIDKERIIKAIAIALAGNEIQNGKIESSKINSLVIGIMPERNEIKKRITERLKYRLQNGMIEEVENLIKDGIDFEKLNFFGLEYRYIGLFLRKEINYNDMFQKLNSSIHNFAKRQVTWFRKMEKEGVEINWLENPDHLKAKVIIEKFISDSKSLS
ncbi:MAG: tRNA (adenosine(37)-N6)-dimethylallyltransferase MiaA [Bacteroidetes bacterium]|nr:tRNA (adenosine(37)-N6)-dimethylallyltransferase MiaA [Bacteroidota bacterium]